MIDWPNTKYTYTYTPENENGVVYGDNVDNVRDQIASALSNIHGEIDASKIDITEE